MPRATKLTPATLAKLDAIHRGIYLIRSQRVMLDSELAALYGVPTKVLLQAVARNRSRFPADFAYLLTLKELTNLRSQFVTSSAEINHPPHGDPTDPAQLPDDFWGGRRTLPMVFTEQGVAMLSSVLRSPRAVAVNIEIMRAFVRARRLLAEHADLASRLDELEDRCEGQFQEVFEALRQLMTPPEDPPEPPRKKIGFRSELADAPSAGSRRAG